MMRRASVNVVSHFRWPFQRAANSFLVLIIALICLFKGFQSEVGVWGEPYWLINYSHGLVRRGLMGEIFSLFYEPSNIPRIRSAILALHWTACLLLVVSIWDWARSLASNNMRGLFAVFGASQFLPTMGYLPGFLDPYIFLCLIAGTVALMNERF